MWGKVLVLEKLGLCLSLGFCLGLLGCLNNMKNFTSAEGCLFVSRSVIVEIEDFASGSVFASGSYHLDFATQDQLVFTLVQLGDAFLLPQASVHPEAFLYPLGMRLRI